MTLESKLGEQPLAEQEKAVANSETSGNPPEKTPPQDKLADFSKMDSQQKADKIDEILGDSTELASAYQDIEFEVAGGKNKLKEQVKLGWADRFKIWRAGGRESEKGKAIEFRKIAEVAHQEVEKKLVVIEQTDGQQLKDKKAALAVHEKSAANDVKSLEELGLHSEDQIAEIKTKLTGERKELTQEVEQRRIDLESKLAEFSEPALEKQKKLGECVIEYKGYHDNVVKEIGTVRGNITKYERGLASLKLEGATAEEYKNKIRQAINDQKGELAKLEASQQALKQRLEAVKANKSEVDAYLAKINKIGKTREEISAEERAKREKAAVVSPQAAVGGGGERVAVPTVESAIEVGEEDETVDEPNDVIMVRTPTGWKAGPRGGRREPTAGRGPGAKAGALETAPTAKAATAERGEDESEEKEWGKVKMAVKQWLTYLDLSKEAGAYSNLVKNNFKLAGKPFDETGTTEMTWGQVKQAYVRYLREANETLTAAEINNKVKGKFEKIKIKISHNFDI